jgi:hypothetical protein
VVITSIESAGANKCDYYGYGNSVWLIIFGLGIVQMRDICGKFQIGDTITFTKVKNKHFCEYQLEVVNILVQTNSHK